MTTSNTYLFNPGLGETLLYAYGLCGVRPTALTQEHFETGRIASNLLLGRWSSQGVNLWAVDTQTAPLVQGQATYTVPANTIVILDAYITIGSGAGATNRLIFPISRSEYASYPNPQMQAPPTVFWMDRLLAPTITLYPTPDGNEGPLTYYRVRQVQDANFSNGQQIEIPYYFLDAFALGLAARLALTYAPDRAGDLKALADEAYGIASSQNVESGNFYVSPTVSGYWRA